MSMCVGTSVGTDIGIYRQWYLYLLKYSPVSQLFSKHTKECWWAASLYMAEWQSGRVAGGRVPRLLCLAQCSLCDYYHQSSWSLASGLAEPLQSLSEVWLLLHHHDLWLKKPSDSIRLSDQGNTAQYRLMCHITLKLQSLSGWSEEVTLSYNIELVL